MSEKLATTEPIIVKSETESRQIVAEKTLDNFVERSQGIKIDVCQCGKKLKVAACRLDQKGRLPNVGAASFCFLAVVTSVPDPFAGYGDVLFSSC